MMASDPHRLVKKLSLGDGVGKMRKSLSHEPLSCDIDSSDEDLTFSGGKLSLSLILLFGDILFAYSLSRVEEHLLLLPLDKAPYKSASQLGQAAKRRGVSKLLSVLELRSKLRINRQLLYTDLRNVDCIFFM